MDEDIKKQIISKIVPGIYSIYLYCWWFNSSNVGAISRFSRRSLGAVLFVMLGGRYPFDGKAMPLEVQHMQQWMRIFPDFSTEKRGVDQEKHIETTGS